MGTTLTLTFIKTVKTPQQEIKKWELSNCFYVIGLDSVTKKKPTFAKNKPPEFFFFLEQESSVENYTPSIFTHGGPVLCQK